MSAWYRTGTISSAGNVVTGTGTKWADNKMGVGTGQMLIVPGDGIVQMHEILRVDSDTQLRLVNAPSAALSGAYAILSIYNDSITDLSRQLSAGLAYYQSQMDGWQQILTGSGSVTIIAPDGTEVTIPSLAGMVSTQEMNDAIAAAITPLATKTEIENLMPKGGGAFTGPVTLSGNATAALNPITKQQFDVLNNDAFTASQVANTAWTPLTLINGWVNSGQRAAFRKVLGKLDIDIHINSGTFTDGTVVAVMPTGSRPAQTQSALLVAQGTWNNNYPPRMFVQGNGDIAVWGLTGNGAVDVSVTIPLE